MVLGNGFEKKGWTIPLNEYIDDTQLLKQNRVCFKIQITDGINFLHPWKCNKQTKTFLFMLFCINLIATNTKSIN